MTKIELILEPKRLTAEELERERLSCGGLLRRDEVERDWQMHSGWKWGAVALFGGGTVALLFHAFH